ncbi:MAG: DNA repair protein RadA [Gemmatimonadota bacterium]|nr:MAG: DNA repair protein RadA [Gemmatimonadota bacterium]
MANVKQKSIFVCQTCAFTSPKWMGKCPECQAWNTFSEEPAERLSRHIHTKRLSRETLPEPVTSVLSTEERRLKTDIGEFDRILGGGIVPGSFVLIGGDPGIGKSTLLLQVSHAISQRVGPVLYVSGEESVEQIKLRADRLNVASERLLLLSETRLDSCLDQVRNTKPVMAIIDSIQTMFASHLESAPGSVSQIRECAAHLMHVAKGEQIPICIIGHVTKDGSLAGPRMLEHMVDTVLYFEGERHHAFRILRAVKNRFGSTNEIGVFEMKAAGLREVANPSELLLAERPEHVSGSIVVCSVEGTRPLLVELQALVSPTNYGLPQRVVSGIDHRRLSLLIAVLEKRAELKLGAHDIFVNVAGGVRIDEPAVDLGTVAAIASSLKDEPVDSRTVAIGEVGLGGEVRAVSHIEKRIGEAAKLGFTRCVCPENNVKGLRKRGDLVVAGVQTVAEALCLLLD